MIFSSFCKKFYIMLLTHKNDIVDTFVIRLNSSTTLVWQRKRYSKMKKLLNQSSRTFILPRVSLTAQFHYTNIRLTYACKISKTDSLSWASSMMSIFSLMTQPFFIQALINFWINITIKFFLFKGCFENLLCNILYFHKNLKLFSYKVTKHHPKLTTLYTTRHLFTKI